ncbi:NBR1-Ig-like domain-containing protein [Actinoplanes sp. NEAU-A12]|uniref:NBR1-Ig-like domain-containing protein n=1 Tax=Actinoplanes sandaracinus TaxID=3045177 RepID=A0ABT6WX29_9ACTN|nr:NBR1-Ig-like domain-containing protein [Actinoplanes sandaracinus]MDI6104292.1 NBR1-Ig-like domain-containing protein [Actinoplanes sandaracinus]
MEDQRAGSESIQDGTAAERFAEQLRTLRAAVGNPSFRKLAGRSGRISHTTLHEAAAGTRFPSWETTREFVRACDADEAQWRRRWEDAQRPVTVSAVPQSELTPGIIDFPAAAHTANTVDTPVDAPAAGESAASSSDSSSELVPAGPDALRAEVDPKAPAVGDVTSVRRQRLPWFIAAAAVMMMVAVVGVTVRNRWASESAGPVAAPSSAAFSDALIPGDASKFVSDITYPDGSPVRVNSEFDKVWAIANVGTVAWHKRYLAPMNHAGDEDDCKVPDRVEIGDTPPGEQVMIRVRVTAPSRPGKCWVSWKMVDEHGQPYFPSRRPVYFLVNVTP